MSLRVVFMGTPDFAVPSLRALHESEFEVVGVITATDKMGGRGKKQLLQSAVKRYAVAQGIPVLQPKNLKAAEFQQALADWRADIQVVVAFRMLPKAVWDMPPLGTYNLHGSLLPKYRGAAPIHWAVINGETETGVTFFKIRQEIDTGSLLQQAKMPIGANETTGDVHDRMMERGAEVVLSSVRLIQSGDYYLAEQDDTLATKAPKLYTATCRIDWEQPVSMVHNFIRGLSPYPAAWTVYQGKTLKILRSSICSNPPDGLLPGQIALVGKKDIVIACKEGAIHAEELQLAGKKRMSAADFRNGNIFSDKEILSDFSE